MKLGREYRDSQHTKNIVFSEELDF
jgi:hypothetical protein